MKRCIYMSHRRKAVDDAAVGALVAAARLNNAQSGISGALICSGDLFFQVIEGPDAALVPLVDRILKDDRHEVDLCQMVTCEAAAFPDWSMAYADVDYETVGRLFASMMTEVDAATGQGSEGLDRKIVEVVLSFVDQKAAVGR